ncbi:hypothetical protein CCMSSC00406_0009860 [Pleurotus cornucopiae]|uniref:Uncharacterized protein n=1 Tax=Pleurotus cornucopiae TaxID=5321 RepID=A0ACB7J5H2_PLECO|nr:hypothetical protein CCMSSC00406_0009860 [Pleurotus cornucopiae]
MSHYVSLHSTLPRLLDWLPSPPVELSNVTVNAPLPNIISPPPTSTWGGMGTIPTSDSVFGKDRSTSPQAVPSGSSLWVRIRIRRGYHGSFKISGIPTNSRVAGLIWTSPANPAASSVPSFNSTHAEFGLNQQTQRPSPFRVLYIWGYFVARIKYCAGGFVMPTLPPPHTDF